MRICIKCVLDEHFPGISFDEQGLCNFCRFDKPAIQQQQKRAEYTDKFIELASTHKGTGAYDAIVAYSGGKDSTYTLHLLKEKYDLRVLAFTLDNWFFSERAHENIRNVVKAIGVDHITLRPSFTNYRDIVKTSANHDLYSAKAMQRASAVCTSCISLVRFVCFQIAIEKGIPFVAFGMSPGQAPLATSIVKTNAKMMRQSQNAVYDALHRHLGDDILPYFLSEFHFSQSDRFPYSVNPLAFSPYREDEILEFIQQYGWRKPDDTDANSTNCLLNAYANKVHIDRYQVNPYAYEVAGLVRSGAITREEGLKRLRQNVPEAVIQPIEKKLDAQ